MSGLEPEGSEVPECPARSSASWCLFLSFRIQPPALLVLPLEPRLCLWSYPSSFLPDLSKPCSHLANEHCFWEEQTFRVLTPCQAALTHWVFYAQVITQAFGSRYSRLPQLENRNQFAVTLGRTQVKVPLQGSGCSHTAPLPARLASGRLLLPPFLKHPFAYPMTIY